MSSPLGVFGDLPVDLLSTVCRHLPMSDVLIVTKLDDRLDMLVNRFIYREIKGLRVEIQDNHSTINFIDKDGRVKQLNMDQPGWEQVVKSGKCIENLELNICIGKSTASIFNCLKNSSFALRSLKINVKGSVQKDLAFRMRISSLLIEHRSSLRNLEISTTGGQNVSLTANKTVSSIKFSYNQPSEAKQNDMGEYNMNHSFVHTLFHEYISCHTITNVTLEVSSTFNASLALAKAFQIAIPYKNKKILERLTIEFGNSLKAVTEEDMKDLIIRHVCETHVETPNLQNFHCTLPHDEIDLCQEFIASLNEPVRKHRKDSNRPFNSSVSLRAVRCQ